MKNQKIIEACRTLQKMSNDRFYCGLYSGEDILSLTSLTVNYTDFIMVENIDMIDISGFVVDITSEKGTASKSKEVVFSFGTGYVSELTGLDEWREWRDYQTVTDVNGDKVVVKQKDAIIYDYDNRHKQITYSAEKIEHGEKTGFWTEYKVPGTVDSIEDRLKTWNNPAKLAYAKAVGFNASANDPDRKLWRKVVDYVTENQTTFFDKYGDWKKVVGFNVDNGCIELRRRGGKRPGAGRKPSVEEKKELWSVRVTEAEKIELTRLLKNLRGN